MPKATDVIADVLASDLVDDPRRSGFVEPERAKEAARRRRRWGKDATLGAVTLGAIGGFSALARVARGTQEGAFDRVVLDVIGRARHPVTNVLVQGVTFLGSVGGAFAVSLAAVTLARRQRRLAAQIVVGAIGGAIAELAIKGFFQRERPTILAHLEDVTSTSFPSGHSMAAASLYLTLAFVGSRSHRLRPHRAAMIAGASAVAMSIAASRVFLGVHWPTDVLGGLALGTAWACATEATFDFAAARTAEREAEVGEILPLAGAALEPAPYSVREDERAQSSS